MRAQPEVQTRFQRFECKYLVDEATAARIRTAIAPYMRPDRYATGRAVPDYDVHTLYLDSPDLRLFWESEEGICHRLKLRLRHYADGPVFVEIKRRSDRCIRKSRVPVDRASALDLLAGRRLDPGHLPDDQRASLHEFEGWVARWLARPVVWVRYRREAYESLFQSGVRVTFDRQLGSAPAGRGLTPDGAGERVLEPRDVILELKFDTTFPDWMRRLAQSLQLRQTSYSKYGHAVRRGLADHQLPPGCAWAVPRS